MTTPSLHTFQNRWRLVALGVLACASCDSPDEAAFSGSTCDACIAHGSQASHDAQSHTGGATSVPPNGSGGSTGGAPNVSAGGRSSAGGRATGGVQDSGVGSGGTPTGGVPNDTGGAPTGGVQDSGVKGSGGTATGGVPNNTGGVSTGGLDAGDASNTEGSTNTGTGGAVASTGGVTGSTGGAANDTGGGGGAAPVGDSGVIISADAGDASDASMEGGDASDAGASPDGGDGGWLGDAGDAGDPVLPGPTPIDSPVWFGTIRWDAWLPEMVSLGYELPELFSMFPHREPLHGWFASNLPSEGEEQRLMDDDIDAAVQGGLAYWAFVWYPPEVPGAAQLTEGLEHYLLSRKKKRIKFALVVPTSTLAHPGDWSLYESAFLPRMVKLMSDEQYVRIENRPVVFMFSPPGQPLPADKITLLRNAALSAGMGYPYLVNANMDVNMAVQYGYDAITSYGISGARPGTGHRCFYDQSTKDVANWSVGPKSGLKTIMSLTPMNDPRPRTNWPKPYYNYWVDQPLRTEWRNEIKAAIDYAATNPTSVPSKPLALVYGWNELGEGGPGIIPNVQEGSRYLDDLRAVLTDDPTPYNEKINSFHCAVTSTPNGWVSVSTPGAWDSDEQVGSGFGVVATIKSTGSAFGLYGSRGPDRGKVQVLLDGVSQGVVDLYSPTVEFKTTIWSKNSLPPTPAHTVQLRVLHEKSAAATDYKVGFDYARIGAE